MVGIAINMKTVKELLNYLEPQHKEKALRNAANYGSLETKTDTISEAINSFRWMGTPEGDSYWSEVYHKYENIETKQLPKQLPKELSNA